LNKARYGSGRRNTENNKRKEAQRMLKWMTPNVTKVHDILIRNTVSVVSGRGRLTRTDGFTDSIVREAPGGRHIQEGSSEI
jgi:hypothetical protein